MSILRKSIPVSQPAALLRILRRAVDFSLLSQEQQVSRVLTAFNPHPDKFSADHRANLVGVKFQRVARGDARHFFWPTFSVKYFVSGIGFLVHLSEPGVESSRDRQTCLRFTAEHLLNRMKRGVFD